MSKCPYCGAEGGGAASCGSCQHHLEGSSQNSGVYQKPGSYKSSDSGSSGGCFSKGTKILTPYGERDISELNKGDLVFSKSESKSQLDISRVLMVCKHSHCQIWNVIFDDNTIVKTTAIHSFNVGGKWKKATNLTPGDIVVIYDDFGKKKLKTIIKSHKSEVYDEVFNLIVDGDYSYFADGAFVSSFSYFRRMRKLMWRIKSKFIQVDELPSNSVA